MDDTVPAFPQMLPPVVDFQFYGDKKANPPDKEVEDTLRLYLEGSFEEYPLWIRTVVKKPDTRE